MPLISYAEVRQQVSLERVLGFLGYRSLQPERGRHRGMCHLGCSSRPRVCEFDLKANWWRCYRCLERGNQLDLFAKCKRLSLYPAAVQLCQVAGIPVPWLVQVPRK